MDSNRDIPFGDLKDQGRGMQPRGIEHYFVQKRFWK